MDYGLLQKLCQVHSVTGDTDEIRRFLLAQLKTLSITPQVTPTGNLIWGNTKNPDKLVYAHADEVGFQITKIESDGKLRILPVGWVFANRLDHAIVYVAADGEMIGGVVLHEDVLRQSNQNDFSLLYVDVGVNTAEEVDLLGIRVGQTGSFQKVFYAYQNGIISASMDNKASLCALFTVLKRSPEVLKTHAFAIGFDEEMQDHDAYRIGAAVPAPLTIILDYFPIHQKAGEGDILAQTGKGPLVLYRGGEYIIHSYARQYFESKIHQPFQKVFVSQETMPTLEPHNFEMFAQTCAVIVCVPAFGYHGSAYSARRKDLDDFSSFLLHLLETPFSLAENNESGA